MMKKVCGNNKSCGTCEFWTGNREPARQANWVETDGGKGKCGNAKSPWCGRDMSDSGRCSNYTPWKFL
ncbi:MAG: hypothetical protein K2G36_11345 [Ruminococcus sp.]|nr:hypothetical protein [Ruminococcus sp.]